MMPHEKPKEALRRFTERWWTRRVQIILAVVATLLVAAMISLALVRHIVRRGWPQTEGALTLTGLRAPVTVVRDRYGVPHIYAESAADLFFSQGYVHAQDRFWAMELNRHRGRGTLAELLGDEALATDEAWGALNLARIAKRELGAMDVESRAPLDAYAAGVNAWLESQRLPFEFTLLRWRGHEIDDPATWTAEDSLLQSLV
ncbi:MAG: penicillin acylase family protein [Anaerolineae bacterium]|nr:MAG: penicillin acylase family protein [Anaerolineae bacterium]